MSNLWVILGRFSEASFYPIGLSIPSNAQKCAKDKSKKIYIFQCAITFSGESKTFSVSVNRYVFSDLMTIIQRF